MNYYEKHIGDYIRDTVSLSMLEDGAYNRLMDQCYQTERPLPLDKKMIYRLARATSTAERKAVDFVVETFFQKSEEGYVQKRIQEEIERYWERDTSKEQTRENDKERQRRARERRKQLFEELRSHGITPEFNTPSKELSRILSRVTSGGQSQESHENVTRDNTAIQSPDTRHQTPDIKPEPSLVASTVVGTGEAQIERLSDSKRNVEIAVLLRAKGVKPFTFAHPQAIEWAANPAVTDEILDAAVTQARDYKPTGDISPNYLKPIVEQLLNPPAPSATQAKPRDDWTWKKSDAGIDRKGKELGMHPRPTESYRDYADRIEAEIAKRRGGNAA